jgi:hypothetical protein
MSEIAQYILSVVVIPAAIAAAIALPFALRPLRDVRVAAEAGVACALMAAFVASFTNELGWNAILRQFVEIPNDDAPFERWHRVGATALLLGLAAWGVAFLRGGAERSRAAIGVAAALLAAITAAVLVRFPGASLPSQLTLAALAIASMLGFASVARRVMLWAGWLVFGLLAFLAGEGGFASLAVMCGATSAACFLVGAVRSIVALRAEKSAAAKHDAADGERPPAFDAAPRGVAAPIALGTLAAVVAVCGHSYNATEIPAGFWHAAVLLPFLVLVADIAVRPSVVRHRRILGFSALLFGAAVVVAGYALWRAQGADPAPSTDQELLDMYGG